MALPIPLNPRQPVPDRDEAERVTIKTMIANRSKRDQADCIRIGKLVFDHFVRINLPPRETQRYTREHFGTDWDYLKRFQNLFVYETKLREAEKLQAERGWINDFPDEPGRSNNLLTWYGRTLQREGSGAQSSHNPNLGSKVDETDWLRILTGDCRILLHGLPDNSFQACITSPPYWLQRDYGIADQIGLEDTIGQYIRVLVIDTFRQVKRVLRDDGILWVVMGDRVARGAHKGEPPPLGWAKHGRPGHPADELPVGNLLDMPGRFARAMQNDNWVYRSELIWEKAGRSSHGSKRPQTTHEKIMMFTKSMDYRFYQTAVQQPGTESSGRPGAKARRQGRMKRHQPTIDLGSVWCIAAETNWRLAVNSETKVMSPFPREIVRRCLLYSTVRGDRVLDPFGGTGTTGVVARMFGRRSTLIELNPDFARNAEERITATSVAEIDEPTAEIIPEGGVAEAAE